MCIRDSPSTMPRMLQVKVSVAGTDDEAVSMAVRDWPNGGMNFPKADIRNPEDFEAMAYPGTPGQEPDFSYQIRVNTSRFPGTGRSYADPTTRTDTGVRNTDIGNSGTHTWVTHSVRWEQGRAGSPP